MDEGSNISLTSFARLSAEESASDRDGSYENGTLETKIAYTLIHIYAQHS